MALVRLDINIPDAQMSRVQTALRARYGQVDDGAGGLRDRTNAELVDALRFEVINQIKGIVFSHEAAAKRAEALTIPQVDAT